MSGDVSGDASMGEDRRTLTIVNQRGYSTVRANIQKCLCFLLLQGQVDRLNLIIKIKFFEHDRGFPTVGCCGGIQC